ncbi:MAG: GntR family transcriptional regulator [Ruminococcaceae bacterium]|nr:GntR family transcriptional regulator [Oscillospiraceae bacterium]
MHILERLPRETGRDYALRTIKENIIHLDLAPGSQISENELAAEMGLSRTPVREALIELSKVKIVEIQPQKKSTVSLIDYAMVDEARFMRNLLECAVVELDCEMATAADIDRLRENVRLQNFYLDSYYPDSLMALDNQFHAALFEIAQKSQVYMLMQGISIHFDRVRSMALNSVKNTKIVEDHAIIVKAIESRDAALARSMMEKHLNRYKIDASALRKTYPDFFMNTED